MLTEAGIVLVAAGIGGAGFLYATSLREELRRAEAFLRLAHRIRARIACFRQPLSAIYEEFSDEVLDNTPFGEALRTGGFAEALAKCGDGLGLPPSFMALLYDFGQELGRSSAEEQIRHCDRCIGNMEEAVEALRREYPVRSRLSRTLSLCLAAMAALLLI